MDWRRHWHTAIVCSTGASLLAACSVTGEAKLSGGPQSTQASLVISGHLYYPERIALPPNSEAIVELAAGEAKSADVVTEWRDMLDGRQVPIPFTLEVAPDRLVEGVTYRLRGGVRSQPGLLRVTEAVVIEPRAGTMELGDIRLHPVDQAAFGKAFVCDGRGVTFGSLGLQPYLSVDGYTFDMRLTVSASGNRYAALDGSDTVFWSKGDTATLTVRGGDLQTCVRMIEPELPFIARGQEPGWHLRIDTDAMVLRAHYGEEHLSFPTPTPEGSPRGIRYDATANGRRLQVQIVPGICRDRMTGMPQPFQVRYQLDDDQQAGCGGDPAALISGPEWRIVRLGDSEVVDGSDITIQFLGEEGRVAGGASCNRFMGGMQLTGEGLRLEDLATTMMACVDPALAAQETRYIALLQSVYRFDIDEQGRLVLHAGEQQTTVASR